MYLPMTSNSRLTSIPVTARPMVVFSSVCGMIDTVSRLPLFAATVRLMPSIAIDPTGMTYRENSGRIFDADEAAALHRLDRADSSRRNPHAPGQGALPSRSFRRTGNSRFTTGARDESSDRRLAECLLHGLHREATAALPDNGLADPVHRDAVVHLQLACCPFRLDREPYSSPLGVEPPPGADFLDDPGEHGRDSFMK